MRVLHRIGAAMVVVLAFAPAAPCDATVAPAWQAPTPSDGSAVAVRLGAAAHLLVVATSPDAATSLHITARAVPKGALLTTIDGNPAAATIAWRAAPGTHVLALAVVDPASGAQTPLTLTLRTLPPPQPETFSLTGPGAVTHVALVVHSTAVRAGPLSSARVVARLSPLTVDAMPDLVETLAGARTTGGTWIRVRLPVRPNGSTGWVRRSVLGPFRTLRTLLVVDRRALTATLYRGGRAVFRAPVGVGAPGTPTPAGRFFVREKLTGFSDPVYGPIAFGTNGRSPVLTDWPGGGFVGIHGTDAPFLLPGRVSHGCVRMRNEDIVHLASLMPLGTPVTIR